MQSKVRRATRGTNGWVVYLFFGIFLLAGLGAWIPLFVWPAWNVWDAGSWEPATCTVTSSRVGVHRGDDSTTYSIDISYQYEVGGVTYRGAQYNFNIGSSSGRSSKQAVVDAHPPGAEVRCFVDPEDLGRSVINRDPGMFLLWGLFPIPFVGIGLGGIFFGFRGRKKTVAGKATFREAHPEAPEHVEDQDGAVELVPSASPGKRVVIAVLATLAVNAFLSIFVCVGAADGEVFVWVILTPFLLVGAGMVLVWVPYTILGLLNPIPKIVLSTQRIIPGADVELLWEFNGDASRIREFTIELEGRETARYRRGTDTVTVNHVFHSDRFAEPEPYTDVGMGIATVSIPARTMPTFVRPNNKVRWYLKLNAEIPRWPDVVEEFEIQVVPPEPGEVP